MMGRGKYFIQVGFINGSHVKRHLSTVLVPWITGDSVELRQELLDSFWPPNGTDLALADVSSDQISQRCDSV